MNIKFSISSDRDAGRRLRTDHRRLLGAHPHSAYRAIHQYAINGDVAAVAAELAQHPDEVNLPEDHELTPLHLAAQNCHSNVVVLLLAKGAK